MGQKKVAIKSRHQNHGGRGLEVLLFQKSLLEAGI
jgi:hypothetical protein